MTPICGSNHISSDSAGLEPGIWRLLSLEKVGKREDARNRKQTFVVVNIFLKQYSSVCLVCFLVMPGLS